MDIRVVQGELRETLDWSGQGMMIMMMGGMMMYSRRYKKNMYVHIKNGLHGIWQLLDSPNETAATY